MSESNATASKLPFRTGGPPKLFISYRWSSPQHEEWVLSLATNLRSNGIEVILDKWHLQEGQDAYAFMERMATDPDVSKVLLICDRSYVERADKREGGVGTEAQIVSPQVYEKSDQTKFAAAVVEFDVDGKPFLPVYMRTRIYFDLASEDAFSENYEKIVRWAFGKPFYAVPPVGGPPEFLDEAHSANVIAAPSVFAMRASRSIGGSRLLSAASSVLDSVASGIGNLILTLVKEPEPDQVVVDTIKGSIPLREQVLEAFDSLIASDDPDTADRVHSFLERLLTASAVTPVGVQYCVFDNDVVKFLANSWLLGFVALCMKRRRFTLAATVLSMPFYKQESHSRTGKTSDYGAFSSYLRSLEHRKQRLNLNRISIYADLIQEISENSLVDFSAIIEADFTLYLRSILAEVYSLNMPRWYPATLVFATDEHGSFPTYARASSEAFYRRLQPLLGGTEAIKITEALVAYAPGAKQSLRFEFWEVDAPALANSENLGIKP